MGKFTIVLSITEQLLKGTITKVIDRYRDVVDDLDEVVGYDVVEVEIEQGTLPQIKNYNGTVFEAEVIDISGFVKQWVPV